jgi:hypothetical protein
MTISARETMEGVRNAYRILNDFATGNAAVGVVRSISEDEDGGDVAVFGFGGLSGPAVLIGTVNPVGDTDTVLKLTPNQARDLGIALLDSADEADESKELA